MNKIIYDFIQKHVGFQDIEVTYTNVTDGTSLIYAQSTRNFAVCPKCKRITQTVHNSRCQPYKYLPMWGMETVIMLTKRRYICDCDIEHPFDENIVFYQEISTPDRAL